MPPIYPVISLTPHTRGVRVMRTVLLLALLFGLGFILTAPAAHGQSSPPSSLTLLSVPPPPPVAGVSASNLGNSGNNSYCWWVVPTYPIGDGPINTAPACLNQINGPSATNTVRITWPATPSATGYRVLRSTSPTLPITGGVCVGCSVTTTASTTFTDTGAAGTNYTPGATAGADFILSLDNLTTAAAIVRTRLGGVNYTLPQVTGTPTAGNCAQWTAGGNLADSGAVCGGGGGGGNVGGGTNLNNVGAVPYVSAAATLSEDRSFLRSGTGKYLLYDPTAVTGETRFVLKAGAGQSANLLEWQNNAGTVGAYMSADGGEFKAGLNIFAGNYAGFNGISNAVTLANAVTVQWSNDATRFGTKDTGLGRNAAGVAEVNDGTAGTLRDLTLRNLIPTGTVSGIKRSFGGTFASSDGVTPLTAGATSYFVVPYACTITAWNVVANAGTATVDIWKVATGTAIPTAANTITAAATPALSVGTAVRSTTLTGWTTAVAANAIIGVNLKIVATATYVNLTVECVQ